MIIGLQLVALVFSLTLIYLAFLNYRRKEIDKAEFIYWTLIWSVTLFVVIFPEFLRVFAKTFFITRLFDLMVVGGFILVISMVARVYVKTKRIENKLEKYVRSQSLKNEKKVKQS
jgi:hypothetical protein